MKITTLLILIVAFFTIAQGQKKGSSKSSKNATPSTIASKPKNPAQAAKAKQLYTQATGLERTGKKDEAKKLFLQVIRLDSAHYMALDQLGEYYREKEKIDSAIHYFNLSKSINKDGILARQSLASLYQIKGNTESAMTEYKQILEVYPNDPQAFYGLGILHMSKNEYTPAIGYAESAVRLFQKGKLDKQAADAKLLAGQGYMNNEEYKKALKYFESVRKDFDTKHYYYYYVGLCKLKMGDLEDAQQNFSKAERMGYKIPVPIKTEISQKTEKKDKKS